MREYQKLNMMMGWLAFALATIVYFLTLEPTASWWDCGEYIATAYKLQVGHPPGAPTFQFIGRFFSLFAFGDTSKVAVMINAISALSSSFTILFLFWTITMLARKLVDKGGEMTRGQMIAILGSGFVGSMAFTFSDSFWFSAVEGEVYAMSSLFTALTFWAMLKWDSVADEKHSLRWLILILYLIGVSIGIHLLILLTIPALVFIYYFRRYKATRNGLLFVGGISVLLLMIIMYVIIPGIVSLSGMFELFFVNSLGMPFNSGTIIYFALLIGLIVWGLQYTRKHNKIALNTILLGLTFLLIGYSSFFLLIIRSNANTPIDENSPEDAIGLLSYLNREQYGTYPILNGQYYNAPIEDYGDGSPIYVKNKEQGKYIITDNRKGTQSIYDKNFTTIFPRMWSSQKSGHINLYKQYGKIKGRPVTVSKGDGTTEVRYRPTFTENLRFFFTYQVGHMYLRYFMWNFAGRQNDIESQGEPEHGNWITGFNFLDKRRLGNQEALPLSRQNKAHNKFYMLPLALGLIGLFFQLSRSRKNTFVVFLLFLMTGLAIVVYLNQYPLQPRERDYAYVGSFYAFTIWIGLGVLALYEALARRTGHKMAGAVAVTLASLMLVPGIMAKEGWDDHDRSNCYAARDFATNYLNACDSNAVLITFGDNDTFPLWYAQEVEDVRTDIRVVNHMLASGAWYVQQLSRKFYDAEPLPLTLAPWQYEKGVNSYIPIFDRNLEGYTDLKQLIDFIASENDQTKISLQDGRKMNYIPTRKVRLVVDSAACIDNGIVPLEMADRIVPYIEWEIKQSAIFKNDLMLLDFLATNNWERAFYVANPNSLTDVLNIDEYFHQEGVVYKFMPVKATEYIKGIGGVNGSKSYDIFMSDCVWGNLEKPDVLVSRESYRNTRLPKQNFLRAAEAVLHLGENEKAIQLLDTCQHYFPHEKVTYGMLMLPFAEIYFEAGAPEKGKEIVTILYDRYKDDLRYYNSVDPDFVNAYYKTEVQRAVSILHRLGQLAKENDYPDLGASIDSVVYQQIDQL